VVGLTTSGYLAVRSTEPIWVGGGGGGGLMDSGDRELWLTALPAVSRPSTYAVVVQSSGPLLFHQKVQLGVSRPSLDVRLVGQLGLGGIAGVAGRSRTQSPYPRRLLSCLLFRVPWRDSWTFLC
jgi:hypothetical protein